jgi:hypothetical protein
VPSRVFRAPLCWKLLCLLLWPLSLNLFIRLRANFDFTYSLNRGK